MRAFSIFLFWLNIVLPVAGQAPVHYLPPGISFVRAVVSVEASYLTNATWQGLAARQGLLLAVAGHNPQTSLSALATATGHPEVLVAPYVPYGLSANGRRSVQTAVASPGRVAAVLAHHPGRMFAQGNDGFNFHRLDGTVAADTLFDFAPAFSVPMLIFAGEQDNLSGFVLPMGNFEWGRAMGNAPWTFVCEPATPHTGNPLPAALTTALLEAILVRRLPAQHWASNQQPTLLPIDVSAGYLGDTVSRATAAHADFTGDRSRASWLPDAATAGQWSAFVRGVPFVLPAQPISLPTATVNFQALDAASSVVHPSNAAGGTSGEAAWKVCGNLKEGDLCYVNAHGGAVLGIPNTVRGAEWIRPHPAAAAFTGAALARFDLDADAEVFVAHDSRIITKPAWMTGWTNTGEVLQVTTGSSLFSAPVQLSLFRRSFLEGETIHLGPNGTTSGTLMYLVVVKPSPPTGGGSPVISVGTADANAAETGTDGGVFLVSRSGSLAGSLMVTYHMRGTATAGSDYVALPGVVTIPDGVAAVTVPMVPLDDAEVENAETAIMELQAGAGYALSSSASAAVSIADNDGAPLPSVDVSVSHETVTEGDGVSFTLTVSRSGSTATALATTLSVTGNAGYGNDYEAIALNVTIPSGSAAVAIPVNILNDGIVEAAETISFSVIPTTAYVVGAVGAVSVLIVDDDSPPAQTVTIAVSPISGSEDGGNPAVFTVSRASALTTPLMVSLGWAGSAQTGADVGTVPTFVEIPAGQAAVTFSVVPMEDATSEGAETLIANVLASFGVTPGAASAATFTINDNDNSQRALMARQVFASPATGALRMDLYVPRGESGAVPCVILLAGGGWQNGTRSTLGIASALNTAGMACAAVDYRLTGVARWPAQIHDVKAAVRWLRANSAALGLDPERFGIHGQGSGGHLGLMAGLSAANANVVVNSFHTDLEGNGMGNYGVSDRVHAVCAWYAPTDLLLLDNAPSSINHNLATAQTGYLMGLNPPPPIAGTAIQTIPERTASANPGLYADHTDPPVLFMHGSADMTTPLWQSAVLHNTLRRVGVRSIFLPVVGAGSSLPADENNPVVAFFSRELAVSMANQPPVAQIRTGTFSGNAPLLISFDGSGSSDQDGSIIRYAWSLGNNSAASGAQVSHTLSIPGRYRVTLTVEDDDRALHSSSVVVDVFAAESGAQPSISLTAPIAGATAIETAAFHLQASAIPVAGSSIAAVEFYSNGSYVGRDTVSPYGLSLGNIPAGDVIFTARAIDASGTAAWSQQVMASVRSANPQPVFVDVAGTRYFGLQMYRHSAVVNRSELVEFSANLRDWTASPVLQETEEIGVGQVRRVYRSNVSASSFPSGFLRVTTRRSE